MAMRLTRARMLAGVKESKESLLVVRIVLAGLLVGGYAGACGLQVRLFEDVGLRLEVRGGEDEVLRDDGELVEDEEVRGSHVGDAQGGWRVGERVDGLGGG